MRRVKHQPTDRRAGRGVAAGVAIGMAAMLVSCAPGLFSRPEREITSQSTLVVFLVRHAEKVDPSADPNLSPEGRERAADLAAVLSDAALDHIHSSDYIRTRETAAPLAAALGLEVELYDPRDLDTLVTRLRKAGGRHLVVGHSNTTPAAVELLGGEPGTEIDEASEYDRLYVVTVAAGGGVSTVLLRYGARRNFE